MTHNQVISNNQEIKGYSSLSPDKQTQLKRLIEKKRNDKVKNNKSH